MSADKIRIALYRAIKDSGKSLSDVSIAAGWQSPTTLCRKMRAPGSVETRPLNLGDIDRVLGVLGLQLSVSITAAPVASVASRPE